MSDLKEEIREYQLIMQDEVKEFLQQFFNKTGLLVESIDVENINITSIGERLSDFTVDKVRCKIIL